MTVTVIDYGVVNISAICNMLRRLGVQVVVANKPSTVLSAKKIILPGVGSFDQGINALHERDLVSPILKKCHEDSTPLLGICLGMQLLGNKSEESQNDLEGLGLIDGSSFRFKFPIDSNFPIPHIGWNHVNCINHSLITDSFSDKTRFYFVHSYHFQCANSEDLICTSKYGIEFASIIRNGNVLGTQFHPEKSHKYGFKILRNFIENY